MVMILRVKANSCPVMYATQSYTLLSTPAGAPSPRAIYATSPSFLEEWREGKEASTTIVHDTLGMSTKVHHRFLGYILHTASQASRRNSSKFCARSHIARCRRRLLELRQSRPDTGTARSLPDDPSPTPFYYTPPTQYTIPHRSSASCTECCDALSALDAPPKL